MKWVVFLLAAVLLVLHHDTWNFASTEPLVFGFLPVGLAYHAAFAFACSILMGLLVRFAWPSHLEKYEAMPPADDADNSHGGH